MMQLAIQNLPSTMQLSGLGFVKLLSSEQVSIAEKGS